MSGSRRPWLLALTGAIVIVTGVALAAPVPVLTMTDGRHLVVAPLDAGDALTYSYRQSIYDVPVYEEFVRRDYSLDLLRVRSSDIRSVEYFRWDGDIVQGGDGLWVEDAPASEHARAGVSTRARSTAAHRDRAVV